MPNRMRCISKIVGCIAFNIAHQSEAALNRWWSNALTLLGAGTNTMWPGIDGRIAWYGKRLCACARLQCTTNPSTLKTPSIRYSTLETPTTFDDDDRHNMACKYGGISSTHNTNTPTAASREHSVANSGGLHCICVIMCMQMCIPDKLKAQCET